MNDTFEIKDKTALVTGSNRGIGEAFVNALLKAGAKKIYAGVRNIEYIKALTEKHPNVIEPVLLDVTNPKHIADAVRNIHSLDMLINNAGIVNPCTSTSDELLPIAHKEMESNYFGPMALTKAVLPLLKQSKQAAIVNVCSIAAISNFPTISPYSASKAALHSYTQGLRADLADNEIQVLGVYPGPTDTRMTEGWEVNKAKPEQIANKTFEALMANKTDVFPDDFSEQMYAAFLKHPHELEKIFAQA